MSLEPDTPPELVDRRRALALLGGAGLAGVVFTACSSDGAAGPATTAVESTTSPSTSAAPPASTAAPTTVSTTESTAAADTAATAETVADASVTEIPDETAGPFPGDGTNGVNVLTDPAAIRRDITTSFGDASGVADGIPMDVTLTVLDVAAGGNPLPGAAVYLWHCDAEGRYSLYSDGVTGENYLRGVQETDAAGQVTFRTIVPGCYPGRWPHMHFAVYADLDVASNGRNAIKTSQLALPQAAAAAAYDDPRYRVGADNLSRLSLTSDMVFSDDGAASQLAAVSGDAATGYSASLTVGV